jgi:CheY-like chemotaxis protein
MERCAGLPGVAEYGRFAISLRRLTMSDVADLIRAIVGVLWVGLAVAVIMILRNVIRTRSGSLTRLGLGPSGVTMDFAEAKLDEAVRGSSYEDQRAVGQAAKRSVLDRLQRNSDLLARARILWADDHPDNNAAIVDLLKQFGTTVETPRSNGHALALIRASRYDVVISDVARDTEGPGSDLKGLELAEAIYSGWGMQVLLFTARFDPATMPGKTDRERLELVETVRRCVFGLTNRTDEALHLILDVLERS